MSTLAPPVAAHLRVWDGSETGPADAPVVVARSRRALRLAQAYVTGEPDVEGDLAEGLRTTWAAQRKRGPHPPRPTSTDRARALVTAVRLGAAGPPPPAPASRDRLPHMRPLGETVTLLEEAGLEVRHTESLREHCARTVAAWHHTLEERWDAFVRLAGEKTARVRRPSPVGAAGMPSTSSAGYEDL
ncbi:class I SAM-dependent methyltransferase [Streptomyces sp. ST1015]|uniref:class I SAM-dependent methyltransferase n=1 Tax=unclassified Streptomyces TaxID=2593676 RepID=UPI001CA6D7CC|nr:class I SAM-dependent methyltransferase [Streptomyces sp. ST1015]QZZ25680.1 hypothetical protein A7X85_04865 [Streptomyces sp. ST1015]